jgi:hypothetical protein
VTGKNLLRDHPVKRGLVWYIGLEDPLVEHERRFGAAAYLHKISPEEVEGRLFLDDNAQGFVIAKKTRDGVTIMHPVVDAIINEIKTKGILVLQVDPFVSCHEVTENDNSEINQVIEIWKRVAREGNCSVELSHHLRKLNGQEATADDVRGGGAIVTAARSVRLLSPMTKDQASKFGVTEPWRLFSVTNAKANLGPRGGPAHWREITLVDLNNGGAGQGDQVAVVQAWTPPDVMEAVTGDDLAAIKKAVSEGRWRGNVQAKAWVGKPIAIVLGLDVDADMGARAKVQAIVKKLIWEGVLRVIEGKDERRKDAKFVVVA